MGIDRRSFGVLMLLTAIAVVPAPAQVQSGEAVNRTSPAPAGRFVTALAPPNGSLRRIVRGLDSPSGRAASGSLRIDVEVQVFGLAPAPALVDASDVGIGAPVYGAPTHDEMLTAATPAPLRSTAAYRRLRPAVPIAR